MGDLKEDSFSSPRVQCILMQLFCINYLCVLGESLFMLPWSGTVVSLGITVLRMLIFAVLVNFSWSKNFFVQKVHGRAAE